MRTILFTGKGGVGKTTVSAATAWWAAELGYRTLVVSTDAAHSLADSFDRELGDRPVRISENLWGQEINVLREMEGNWRVVQDYVASVMRSRGMEEIIAEEMAVLPGMEELFSVMEVRRAHRSEEYDCLIIDCAPTGQTLRLLSFPDVARWYMEKLFPVERRISRAVRPVMKSFMSVPIPEDRFYASLERLFFEVQELKQILTDSRTASIRLVLNPEKMVIKEAQRAYTYLNLYGYPVDCVVTNRILPDTVVDKHFEEWHRVQRRYMETISSAFLPLPILKAPFMDSEVVGTKQLAQMAHDIYGEEDPTQVYYEEQPQKIEKAGKEYILDLKLPFVEKEGLQVLQKLDQLIIEVGGYRREIILPGTLALLEVKRAKFEGQVLKVTFGRKED